MSQESTQSLMKKRISELTEAERAQLLKLLGVPGRPYPMVGSTETEGPDGEEILERHLGLLEDETNPLMVYSDRSYAWLVGVAYREMPTPGMLPIFNDALKRRRMDSTRRVQFVKGEPGAGKSYMGKVLGKMRTQEGAYVVDCGGKNLNELLFETALDFKTDYRFYDALDERLARGDVHQISVDTLKAALGDNLRPTDDGRGWVIDWENAGKGTASDLRDILKALERVRRIEHLEPGESNALGMVSQEGPLIKAWKEGREIVLDEYNKSKEGTDDKLQTVLQFLVGEIDECTVENPLKDKADAESETFTFRRADTRPGFFATLTGNAKADGASTRELSKSVNSRLEPQTIPVASVDDWQHRICQMLTGLPVSTLYKVGQRQWDEDPEAFTRMLWQWRTLGLSEEEVENIPALQKRMLEDWPSVIKASRKLARYYHGEAQLNDPDSDLLQSPNMAQIADEVDEEHFNEYPMDFRRVIKDIEDASFTDSEIVPARQSSGFETDDWSSQPDAGPLEEEDPAEAFGTRLLNVIRRKAEASSVDLGKNKLWEARKELMVEAGLLEPQLTEGQKIERELVSDLLDRDPFKDNRPGAQARLLQKLVCDHIRERDPKIKADNDDIVTVARIETALEAVETETREISPRQNVFYVPSMDAASAARTPFARVTTADAAPRPGQGGAVEIANDELVEAESVLKSLAMPGIGRGNLTALWNTALSGSGRTSTYSDPVIDDALAMAEGKSETGLAVTTVMAKTTDSHGHSQRQPLHVVRNQNTDRAVIVGGPVSRQTARLFKKAGLSYVDRTDPRAATKAEGALERVLRGASDEARANVKEALLFRNRLASEEEEADEFSLAELIAREDLEVDLPHYLTNRKAAEIEAQANADAEAGADNDATPQGPGNDATPQGPANEDPANEDPGNGNTPEGPGGGASMKLSGGPARRRRRRDFAPSL